MEILWDLNYTSLDPSKFSCGLVWTDYGNFIFEQKLNHPKYQIQTMIPLQDQILSLDHPLDNMHGAKESSQLMVQDQGHEH
jgi:hypothetical protein